jgi:predicted transposase YdaD
MFALASIAPACPDRRLMYAQLILEYSQKNKKTRQALEELMEDQFKDPFIQEFVEKGRAEGRAEGRVEGRMEALAGALIAVLAARSFTVLDQVRAMITACADPDQLQRWTARAVTATTIDEVFA